MICDCGKKMKFIYPNYACECGLVKKPEGKRKRIKFKGKRKSHCHKLYVRVNYTEPTHYEVRVLDKTQKKDNKGDNGVTT